ncbi:DUF6503 family protein [Ochrovirga pacifica]|uniref:DUF6503 family protein n=1 Tax=Ochrovirga pacifica TaxID=1042376 RepID=UPI000255A7FC|nr:DUF6503 family protein [Ochrovirga pacifica]
MRPLPIFLVAGCTAFALIACQPKKEKESTATHQQENSLKKETEIDRIEAAHHRKHFLSKKAIAFDLSIVFGGNQIFNGKVSLLTDSSKGKIDFSDGTQLITIADKVYHDPAMKNEERIRFNAYTWPYFFLLPYKLSDKGTMWSEFGTQNMNGTPYNIQKLTFKGGTGDTPDDWYYVYSNTENHLVSAAAYIVTYGKSKEKAESDPHAIAYSNYVKVDGIPIASEWSFSGWNKQEGLTEVIGKATLSNIKFVDQVDFTTPENFIKK